MKRTIPAPREILTSAIKSSAKLPEQAAVWLLCAAAVAGPLMLGSTGPWPRFFLEAVMAVATVLWALSGTRDSRSLLLPLAIASLFLFQLLPLPDGILVNLAPVSAGRWKVAREGMATGWATISVEPAATMAAIRRLLLGLATVGAVTSLARTPAYRRWFYTALAASAALIWAAGIAFPVDPENRAVMGFFSLRGPIDFWKTPERGPLQTSGYSYLDWVTVGEQRYQADGAINGDGFGSYIYSNHFANALCLTLPAAWALWMLYTREQLPQAVRIGVLLASMALAGWTTGGLAHSRAGTASLTLAMLVYLSLTAQARWFRWITGGFATAVAVGLIGFVVTFQGPLSGVLRLLPEPLAARATPLLADARIIAAQVAGKMFLASPLLGTGLGTYGDLYPALLRSDHTLYFAHNEYAQFLAESGLLGGGLCVAAAWLFVARFMRFRGGRLPATRLIDAAAWAALAGAAAHAVFDWNMHAPANALLTCIVSGLALSSVAAAAPGLTTEQPTWRGRAATAGLVLTCGCMLPFLARDAYTADALDTLRRANTKARLAAMKSETPPATPLLFAAIKRGASAARLNTGNWQLAAMLGQAHLHLAQEADSDQAREAAGRSAAQWFEKARAASAASRGLPEPVP
jgi:hypothetical protein